jgi:hypothetical protein
MFRAVVFNNEGVRRMEHGLYDDAVVSFTKVLETLNSVIPNSKAKNIYTGTSCEQGSHEQQQQLQPQHHSEHTATTAPREKMDSSNFPCTAFQVDHCQQENRHFVFRDPIEIPFDVVPTMEEPSDKLVNKFVVVIMYNLALAVHLSSLQCQDFACLTRARKLYELAFQMHLEESCDVTLLFSLALMNNLGLIYHLLGEEERSKTCFKNMLATMMYLLESDEAKTIKQWDGLLSNVMDRMFKDHEVAAPAA